MPLELASLLGPLESASIFVPLELASKFYFWAELASIFVPLELVSFLCLHNWIILFGSKELTYIF